MKKNNWFKVSRDLYNSDLWLSESFTRGQAWVDLIGLANFKDGFIRVRGNRIDLKRGQVGWSKEKLCKRWKWSKGKLNRWFNELEVDRQIDQHQTRITSVTTIINYDKYQSNEPTDRTTDEPLDRPPDGPLIKKEKKVKKKKDLTPETPGGVPEIKIKYSESDLEMAKAFFAHQGSDYIISQPSSKNKIKEVIAEWADEFRKLREIDGYTEKFIQDVFLWMFSEKPSRNAEFWRSNTISAMSLRTKKNKNEPTKFGKIITAYRQESKNGKSSGTFKRSENNHGI